MIGREAVIVEIGIDDRRVELLGERHAFLDAIGEDDAAARHDDREFRLGQKVGRLIEALIGAGPAGDAPRASAIS